MPDTPEPSVPPTPPSGTVTFLFTDLEGSTRLLEAHPAAYRAAVARHHALLQGAVEAHGGAVFETVGDAVYAAFESPTAAVAAALAGQLGLQAANWGELGPGALRARMGLHTGEVERQGAHYFGAPLYRCARLTATAHRGQVVLSGATAELVADALPAEAGLLDLGPHRLKDLQRPERVAQLTHPGLPAAFPPLRSLDALPTNLPGQLTPLVGREALLAMVRARLLDPGVRLLTLTGTGGVGKTRLALQAAADLLDERDGPDADGAPFPDGAWLVPLAAVRDPALVLAAVAQALGVKEAAGWPLGDVLGAFLRPKRLLLVLDNFEQVVAAAPVVAELLAAAPRLTALVTSRAVLRLSGEHDLAVPPLELPPPPNPDDPRRAESAAGLSQYESVRLFLERARAARADFGVTDETAPAVAEVCRRLDGLPLAIELAAARVRLLPPPALLARLEHRLPLLTGGARDLPTRHQTLRAAIAWSYDLLSSGPQALFARLAVFVGGWTLDAAEAVCNPPGLPPVDVLDGVAALVDESLVRPEDGPDGEPRFAMLETVAEYAREQLTASGEDEALGRAHAAFYLALAERVEPEVQGSRQVAWLDRLEREHDNLRTALRWWVEAGGADGAERGLRLGGALARFWDVRGHVREGRERLAGLLALAPPGAPTDAWGAARGRALTGAGLLAHRQGDYASAQVLHEQALALHRRRGDRPGAAAALDELGHVAEGRGDLPAARALLHESLALWRELGDTLGLAATLSHLGSAAYHQGDLTAARAHYQDALAHYQDKGHRTGVAECLNNLGRVLCWRGDLPAARALLHESLTLRRELGDTEGTGNSLSVLGLVAHRVGDLAAARAHYQDALALAARAGPPAGGGAVALRPGLRARGSGGLPGRPRPPPREPHAAAGARRHPRQHSVPEAACCPRECSEAAAAGHAAPGGERQHSRRLVHRCRPVRQLARATTVPRWSPLCAPGSLEPHSTPRGRPDAQCRWSRPWPTP